MCAFAIVNWNLTKRDLFDLLASLLIVSWTCMAELRQILGGTRFQYWKGKHSVHATRFRTLNIERLESTVQTIIDVYCIINPAINYIFHVPSPKAYDIILINKSYSDWNVCLCMFNINYSHSPVICEGWHFNRMWKAVAASFQKREGFVHKTSLTTLLFIEISVPSQESERSCICVLGVSIVSRSTIFQFDFGIVPAVWYNPLVFYICHFMYILAAFVITCVIVLLYLNHRIPNVRWLTIHHYVLPDILDWWVVKKTNKKGFSWLIECLMQPIIIVKLYLGVRSKCFESTLTYFCSQRYFLC